MGFPLPLIFDFIPWWSSQGSDESGVSEAWPGPHHLRTIKDGNGRDLTEAEDIKKRWQEYTDRKSVV